MPEKEEIEDILHPRFSANLYGQEDVEAYFLKAFNSGKFPHAWLLCGQKGIGKATFAYRAASFLLSYKQASSADSASLDLFGAEPEAENEIPDSLNLSESNPVFKKISDKNHLDLLVIELEEDEKEITVDKVRVLSHFVSHTAAEASWRVIIIDSIDVMNRNAANALLKILEEPPANTVLFLVCQRPMNVLPTIRSRCRIARFNSLSPENVRKILTDKNPNLLQDDFYKIFSAGSAGQYLALQKIKANEKYIRILEIISNIFSTQDILEIQSLFNKENEQYMFELLKLAVNRATLFNYGIAQPEIVEGEQSFLKKISEKCGEKRLIEIWEYLAEYSSLQPTFHLDSTGISINIASKFA